jgi:hypothetical protein
LRRDPRLLALIIVMPLLLLLLFGVALKLKPNNVRMAYLDEEQSVLSNLIKTESGAKATFSYTRCRPERTSSRRSGRDAPGRACTFRPASPRS